MEQILVLYKVLLALPKWSTRAAELHGRVIHVGDGGAITFADALRQMHRIGLARALDRFDRGLRDRAVYAAAEDIARQAKIGLWSKHEPIPWWEFRH